MTQSEDMLAEPVFPTNIGGDDANGDQTPSDAGTGSNTTGTEGGDNSGQDPNPKTDPNPSAGGEQKQDKGDGQGNPPANETPKTPGERKSKYEYILERKQRQLDKAKQTQGNDQGDGGESDGQDGSIDGVAPEDAEAIDKVVRQKYGAQFEQIERQQFQAEVSEFFSGNEIAKHATTQERELFMEYATHPSRANVPYETIILEVMGGKRLMQIGAEMEREAAKKAWASRIGASVGGQTGEQAPVDFNNMSDADFEAYQHKVRTGQV